MSARYPFGPSVMPPIDAARIRAEQRVGIAYSGGGDRVVIELGIVQAFIELGIVPNYIAGTSAGAYASVLHAADPRTQQYLPLAIQTAQKGVSALHPSALRILFRLAPAAISYIFGGLAAVHVQSLVDTTRLRKLLEKRLPIKTFGQLQVPTSIAATDALTGQEVWFEALDQALVPAILASSAIPGLFPPAAVGSQLYIDGGTSDNLPLFHLAQKGCSVIYACDVGYAGEANKPPRNLIDTVLLAESIGQYAAVLLQQELLAKTYPEVRVIPVRPEVALTTLPSDFKAADIPKYVAQAAAEAKKILQAAGIPATQS
ncbi:MAG: patatin-like phospholipase family protein [Ktedonobacterales bacterium]